MILFDFVCLIFNSSVSVALLTLFCFEFVSVLFSLVREIADGRF